MPKQINWGIIGPGKIAAKFAHDLLLVEGAKLFGVASRDKERAEAFAAQYGAEKYYGSYEELASDPMIDVVYVATPHPFHFPNTMLCLEHGKAVLCEKPFGINAREVEAMIAEAHKRKLFLMEAFWTRFIPGTEKLLELLAADAIGELVMVKADFGFVGDTDPEKRIYNKVLGAGSLLDIGIYPVYFSLLLMGVPDHIKAMATFTNTGVDSICAILFDYERGQKAILDSTILANTQVEALIYGKKGTIKMHPSFHHTRQLTIKGNDGNTETINIDITGNGYYHEITEVTKCLQDNKTESEKMPLSMSLDLIRTLDRVRKEIGLTYQQDAGI